MSTGQWAYGEKVQVKWASGHQDCSGTLDNEQYPRGALFAHLLNLGAKLDDLRDNPSTAPSL